MTRALLAVVLLVTAGCGGEARQQPEATWSMSAESVLVCGPGGRYVYDARVPFEQWCIWECASYSGVPARQVVVCLTLVGDVTADPATGRWEENVFDRPSVTCNG